ncbi:M4 family metallopeptidase [Streptomyces sp. NPDC052114]|uniref:M4 family metallopeptidase n=1 Tax=unclassified Streptomyces TaxID=2593676 RepID=UPI0034448DB8
MDSTLLAALIATAGAGAVAGLGAWLRTRASVRTAARLIYAELTLDSAAVAYFRRTGHWVVPSLTREAWNSHGAALAHHRDSASFEAVHRGYQALEIVPFLANGRLTPADRDQWLRAETGRLVAAIKEVGAMAGMPKDRVAVWTTFLAGTDGSPPLLPNPLLTGIGALPLLERMAEGTAPPLTYDGPGLVLREGAVEPLPGARDVERVEQIVFDAGGGKEQDGLPAVRWTGRPPTGDAAVDEAYDGLVAATRFVREVLGRAEVTVAGRATAAVVHFDRDLNNAWWNGAVLVLGDGDGELFGRFTQCLDVVGAEVWRGLPEIMRFSYEGENGALGTSLCDVFGVLIKQYALGQAVAEEAGWVLGEGLLGPRVEGVGMRSLKAPGTAYDDDTLGKDPQPAHMDGYVRTGRDNGGIHINNGIPNHAFYRLAVALGGPAWERAGLIWWDALTGGEAGEETRFAGFARLTLRAARERYGADGAECRAVRAAWTAVGIEPG